MSTVAVIGAGAWGTALAQASVAAGNTTTLIGRDAAAVAQINTDHRLSRYLGETALDPRLVATIDSAVIAQAELVLCVVPAQATRATLEALGPQALAGKPVVLCAKGLEAGSMMRQSQILADVVPGAEPFVLSGPSFAQDVAVGRPTAVTLAGLEIARADAIAARLAGPGLRPYSSDDLIGVEFAGGLKNVYALGAGAIEGAELGLSARSAFLARAYAELGRLILAMGGTSATLGGLAGMGDLALSCTSPASRNYRFGMALGAGRTVREIENAGYGLAEGVFTAPVARALAQAHDVDLPLVLAVNRLLEGRTPIGEIVSDLMARPLKREGGT